MAGEGTAPAGASGRTGAMVAGEAVGPGMGHKLPEPPMKTVSHLAPPVFERMGLRDITGCGSQLPLKLVPCEKTA